MTAPTLTPRRPSGAAAPIRVVVLDDHTAVRAGLKAILDSAPEMVAVGSARGEAELYALLQRADPSVVVLDVHHPGLHGLALSVQLKRRSPRPRIVLYSGRGGPLLAVAAAVAGVDAVVSKSDTERALLAAIRGEPEARPAVSLGLQARAAARIDSADHAILAMRLDGSTWTEIATTLRLSVATVGERAAAIAVRLAATESPAVPAAR